MSLVTKAVACVERARPHGDLLRRNAQKPIQHIIIWESIPPGPRTRVQQEPPCTFVDTERTVIL